MWVLVVGDGDQAGSTEVCVASRVSCDLSTTIAIEPSPPVCAWGLAQAHPNNKIDFFGLYKMSQAVSQTARDHSKCADERRTIARRWGS